MEAPLCDVKIDLSPSGLPILEENEVNLVRESRIALLDIEQRELAKPRDILLTNLRIFFLDGKNSCACHLRDVKSVESCSSWYSRSTRLKVRFRKTKGKAEVFLKFPSHDNTVFLEHINNALQKKSWAVEVLQVKQADAAPVGGFDTRKAGVAGILRRRDMEREQVDDVVNNAVQDLEGLMMHAKDVVAIIQRYAAYTSSPSSSSSSSVSSPPPSGLGADEERDDMEAILANIGIVSPVTRLTAGAHYHAELAKQVADILTAGARLDKVGGLMTLTDLYCLVNRARGSELISPDDLLHAAENLSRLDVGMYLRTFPGGVLCVQSEALDEDGMACEISRVLERSQTGCLHAAQLAAALRVSLVVATNYLQVATTRGVLVVDDTRAGTVYYPNRFEAFLREMSKTAT